jgi:protein-disulfide isomerase
MFENKNLLKILICVFFSALGPVHSSAQSNIDIDQNTQDLFKKIEEQDDGKLPPVLRWLSSNGTKLTSIGDAGGLDGYIAETPSGKLQTFYVTPDGQHVVAGLLFRKGGVNLTGVQINELQKRYEAAKKQAEKISSELGAVTPELVVPPKATDSLVEVPVEAISNGEVKQSVPNDYISSRDTSEIRGDLENAPWFQVGAQDAPVLYMIADPNCPFCHRVWSELKTKVMSRKLAVRVILIAAFERSEADAISILSRKDPSRVWLTGEGSSATVNISSPPAANTEEFQRASQYLSKNMDLIYKHEIQATPHFMYIGKEGSLYESEGVPVNLDVFLEALG